VGLRTPAIYLDSAPDFDAFSDLHEKAGQTEESKSIKEIRKCLDTGVVASARDRAMYTRNLHMEGDDNSTQSTTREGWNLVGNARRDLSGYLVAEVRRVIYAQ
jgi:hypothetical protein